MTDLNEALGLPQAARDWMLDAECSRPGHDPDWWHPQLRRGDHYERLAHQAVAICLRCGVREQCEAFVFAVENPSTGRHGIWAALTPLERSQLATAAEAEGGAA